VKRAVIVTGAFGVLGAAVARKFADTGAQVGFIDRVAAPHWTRTFPAPHRLHAGVDLTDPAATVAAVREFSEAAGGLDVLVNVAGGFQWRQLAGDALEVWEAMFAMNLKTAVIACSAAPSA